MYIPSLRFDTHAHAPAAASVAFGVVAGTVCNFATKLKFTFGYDDCLDIFASHAIGGVVGNILTGIFAQSEIANLDGGLAPIPGGWLNQNWRQVGIQLADSVAGMSYSFVVTTIILWAMHFIPGLRLRASEEAEIVGIDDAEMGEFAYDYVGIDADIGPKEQELRAESPPSGNHDKEVEHYA